MRLVINLNIFHEQESPTNIFSIRKTDHLIVGERICKDLNWTHSNNFQRKWNHFGGTSWFNVVDENWCFTFIKTVISWPAFCQVRSFFSTVVSIQTKCFHFLLSPAWPTPRWSSPRWPRLWPGSTLLTTTMVRPWVASCANQRMWKSRFRDHISHKHHKQRLCKIIITRVKVHFVDVF